MADDNARRANARPRAPKSPRPVTRDILEALLATCDDSHRGIRDRAMLMLAFASGGRRRSEVTALNVEDIGCDEFGAKGLLWVRLLETKTTRKDQAPKLPLKGRAARAVVHWLEVTGLTSGPLFRPVSKTDRLLAQARFRAHADVVCGCPALRRGLRVAYPGSCRRRRNARLVAACLQG